jgi:hypothetical protein
MSIINYIFKYNLIFKIYLVFIFFFNLLIFYFFGIKKYFINQEKNKDINSITENFDLEYSLIFKKILKILNNPIIFEYQIKQSNKIDTTSHKFIESYKCVYHIVNNLTKFYKSKKYYIKINKLLSYDYPNDHEKIIILTKLICINF